MAPSLFSYETLVHAIAGATVRTYLIMTTGKSSDLQKQFYDFLKKVIEL